jgi:hypothetical protein
VHEDVEFESSDEHEGNDFGNWKPATKSGVKFFDVDGDGQPREEGEEGLEGWTIFVDYDGDGELDSDEPSATTDADGSYSIGGITPGTYDVREVLQEDWKNTFPEGGFYAGVLFESSDEHEGNDFGNTKRVPKNFELTYVGDVPEGAQFYVTFVIDGEPYEVALEGSAGTYSGTHEVWPQTLIEDVMWYVEYGGETFLLGEGAAEELIVEETDNDFEYRAYVFGHKFQDFNENGVWDTEVSEPDTPIADIPLEGWTIQLFRQTDGGWEQVGETSTDADGYYEFTGLLPGTYYLSEVIPEPTEFEVWTQTAGPSGVGDGAFTASNGTEEGPIDFGNNTFLPFEPPDLAIEKSATHTSAGPGDVITYTLTYRNLGPGPATDFTITDDYDERYLTIQDAGGGTVADGKIVWQFAGPLTPEDGPQTITYTAKVTDDLESPVDVPNTVVIEDPEDPNDANNQASWVVQLGLPFLPFTGGEYALIVIAALMAAGLGVTLRRLSVSRS